MLFLKYKTIAHKFLFESYFITIYVRAIGGVPMNSLLTGLFLNKEQQQAVYNITEGPLLILAVLDLVKQWF